MGDANLSHFDVSNPDSFPTVLPSAAITEPWLDKGQALRRSELKCWPAFVKMRTLLGR
jgi:hypothetical protein